MTAGDWGVLAWLVVVPILVVLLASGIGLLGCLFLDWRASRREQRRLQRAFDEAYGYRHRRGTFPEAYYDRDCRFRARGAYPLTPMPPESPAQRQLREWQERLDARHPPESPPGMARRSAR